MSTKQDHRKRLTKMLLFQSLTKLLQAKPIGEITVTELCNDSGINRTTFYLHYKDAYDMLAQIQEEFYNQLMLHMQNIALDSSSNIEIPQFLVEILKFLKAHAEVCSIVMGEHGDGSFIMRLMNIAKEKSMTEYAQLYHSANPEKIEIFYTFVSHGSLGVLKNWFATNMSQSAEELATTLSRLIIQGVGFLM